MGAAASQPGYPVDGTATRSFALDALHEHGGPINCMALSEDSSILATGSDDRTVRLWTAKAPRCDCIGILAGHEGYVICVLIEDIHVLSGSADKTIRKWDMATCVCLLVFEGHEERINRLISTGDFLFSSCADGTVRCWDLDEGRCIREFGGHKGGVFPVLYVPREEAGDDNGGGGTETRSSSVTDEDGMRVGESASTPRNQAGRSSIGTINRPTSVKLTIRDLLISGSTDCTSRVWSFESGRTVYTLVGHLGPVTCLGTDGEGETLMTASTDGTVRSWSLRNGESVRVFHVHQTPVICMSVVDRTVFTGSSDATVRTFHINSQQPPTILKAHEKTIMCVKSFDGMVFSGSGDGQAICWDAKTATVKRTFRGPATNVVSALQVVDRRLFTGGTDGVLRVWTLRGLNPVPASIPRNNPQPLAPKTPSIRDPTRSSTAASNVRPDVNMNSPSRIQP